MLNIKNLFRIFIDTVLIAVSFVLATFLRLEGHVTTSADKFIWQVQLFKILPLIVLVFVSTLIVFNSYRKFWRYTSVDEIIHLARSLFLASLIILTPRVFGLSPQNLDLLGVSYGVTVINFLLALGLLSSVRLFRAYLVERRNIKRRLESLGGHLKRTLVIGAGEAGLQVIKTIASHPEQGLMVVAALDDDIKKHGMLITNNVKVLGPVADIKYWVDELTCDQIIVAIPSLSLREKRKINLLCSETGLDIRIVPGVDQLAGGKVTVQQIRKLSVEDLLGREEVDLTSEDVNRFLNNKRVLVTGAGGSIGRELCKQLLSKCNIAQICLLGKGENSIFETEQDLKELNLKSIPVYTRIADIREAKRIDSIISEFKPDVVFHAAAHKHVNLMELNPCEAFENNVIGTHNLAQISGKHKVSAFVLISTDKAVNPTSIMGCTKNLAEKAMLMVSRIYPETKYTAVRFGNVLGSRGSVLTVWEKKLRSGQALTVTHKEAIRYFMTIPEAAQLVIQASSRAKNGEVMLLDMGEAIKIFDLAKQYIQLSGFTLEDVPIDVIGLKPGEKLYEELLTAEEFVDYRLTDKIYKAKINNIFDDEQLQAEINQLYELSQANKEKELSVKLRELTVSANAIMQ